MSSIKQYFHRRLTLLESMVVILLVAGLGGSGYGLYLLVAAKVLEAQVNAAIPRVCGEIREQRAKLVEAIEAYKAKFGFYPADHVVTRQPLIVDPVTNTLVYELAGVVYNPTNKTLQLPGLEAAEAQYVKAYLKCDGFTNCAETAEGVSRFLPKENLPARQLHDDPDVFALGFSMTAEGLEPEVFWDFQFTPWRYVSSAPTNNPGKFDLWIELGTSKRKLIIGNWKAAE